MKHVTLNDRASTSKSLAFKRACIEILRHTGDLTQVAKDRIIEDLRLQFDYAGQYVAYLDRFKIIDKQRRLIRDVIAQGASSKDIQDAVAQRSAQEKTKIVVEYVENEPEFLYDLPGR